MSSISASSSGMGILGWLTIVFVLLKAFNVVNWSWWLVFSPVLVGFALTVVILFVMMLLFVAVNIT